MEGFFTRKQTESINAGAGGRVYTCAGCGLYRHCESPRMKPYGEFKKGIACVGEAPGQVEDERGRPWQGKAGRLLQRTLRKYGVDLFRDCITLNAVNCRPPDNRTPTPEEINHCRSVRTWKALQQYQPRVIILLGSAAVESVIGHRWSGSRSDNLAKWRGWTIPDQDLKAWVCPTYHPSYLERSGQRRELMTLWEGDLDRALEKVKEPWPRSAEPEIEIVDDLSFLDSVAGSSGLMSFDYETTAIKPHAPGHRIRAAAIASRPDHCWAFLMPRTKAGRAPLRRWLKNREVAKMAHNIKFEHAWSYNILKVQVRGWEWDSMLAAHLLDNRPGISGLKFQTYVNFGVVDYSSDVDQYLRSAPNAPEGGNAPNRIDKLLKQPSGPDKVLRYVGLDAVYEYRLALRQMERLGWDFLPF